MVTQINNDIRSSSKENVRARENSMMISKSQDREALGFEFDEVMRQTNANRCNTS